MTQLDVLISSRVCLPTPRLDNGYVCDIHELQNSLYQCNAP